MIAVKAKVFLRERISLRFFFSERQMSGFAFESGINRFDFQTIQKPMAVCHEFSGQIACAVNVSIPWDECPSDENLMRFQIGHGKMCHRLCPSRPATKNIPSS
jgi:hypothetical protein